MMLEIPWFELILSRVCDKWHILQSTITFCIFGVTQNKKYLGVSTARELSFALVFEFVQPGWSSICCFEQLQQSEVRMCVTLLCVNVVMYVHTPATASQTSCVTSKVCANDSSRAVDTSWYYLYCVTPKIQKVMVLWSICHLLQTRLKISSNQGISSII